MLVGNCTANPRWQLVLDFERAKGGSGGRTECNGQHAEANNGDEQAEQPPARRLRSSRVASFNEEVEVALQYGRAGGVAPEPCAALVIVNQLIEPLSA